MGLWATLGECHILVIPLQLPKLWHGVLAPLLNPAPVANPA